MTDQHVSNDTPEVDIDQLMNEIREEVAQRRQKAMEYPVQKKPWMIDTNRIEPSIVDVSSIRSIISSAEAEADFGARVTPMDSFGRLIRHIALLVGKIVIYLTSFMTVKQRLFNEAILHGLRKITDALETLDQQNAFLRSTVENLKSEQTEIKNSIESIRNKQRDTDKSLENIRNKQEKEIEKTISYLKTNLVLQEGRLTLFLEEAKKRLPEPFNQEQLKTIADEEKHILDALYVSFEDQFRGTREEIKENLRVYLPILKKAAIGSENMPILDLGCGRGEWLELLKGEGFKARGIDLNRILVGQCHEQGLEAIEGDMIMALTNMPDSNLGAVTGFHVIEHLPFDMLINLLNETVRVLKQGGIVIFETPNPQNVLVGSCNFYLDPTHQKPLPSSMMKFIMEARGLSRVEILNLHPFPKTFWLSGLGLAERFNEHFYGPQDYAVIGVKP